MKTRKKLKKILPEVQIIGDLEDVKNLISAVNKKRAVVIFHDGEQGLNYAEIDGEIQVVLQDELLLLETDYRLIFFDFFPGRKRTRPPAEEMPAGDEPVSIKKKAVKENSVVTEEFQVTDEPVKKEKEKKKAGNVTKDRNGNKGKKRKK
ncbi:MAG: hypothetical protein WCI71_15750 [Bacteroidota bacterium]